MTDAELGDEHMPRARRRGSPLVSALAGLLVLGGVTAVAVGVVGQDPAPRAPSAGTGRLTSGQGTGDSTAGRGPAAGQAAAGDHNPAFRPVRIRIPAIDVSSPVTQVGLNDDRTLQVPQPGPDYDKAAWFNRSPAPGQVGPAVIEGHVDGKANGPSVFYRLGTLKPGQRVVVTRRDGRAVRFVVYAIRLYEKRSFPTLKVYGNTRHPELRLITCGGPFDSNRRAGGYTDNVVVFARKL